LWSKDLIPSQSQALMQGPGGSAGKEMSNRVLRLEKLECFLVFNKRFDTPVCRMRY